MKSIFILKARSIGIDLHLIEYRMLIEIAGVPWSGGRKGKLAKKA